MNKFGQRENKKRTQNKKVKTRALLF